MGVCDLFSGGGIETKDRERKEVLDGINRMKWIEDKGNKETERGRGLHGLKD